MELPICKLGLLTIWVRPLLVKSLVIVIFYIIFLMRYVVIILENFFSN